MHIKNYDHLLYNIKYCSFYITLAFVAVFVADFVFFNFHEWCRGTEVQSRGTECTNGVQLMYHRTTVCVDCRAVERGRNVRRTI